TIGLSGALTLLFEVAWTRAFALVLGSSVYAFTVMLMTVLVGLAAGSALVSRWVDRVRVPARALAFVQAGLALAALGGRAALDELPYAFVRLFGIARGRYAVLLPLEFLLTGAVVAPPALLWGVTFPLVVRWATGARASPAGRAVGHLYAVNTSGAIVGSLVAGFGLMPLVGIHGTMTLGVLGSLALALALLLVPSSPRGLPTAALTAGLALVGVLVAVRVPAWNPLMMASGVVISAPRLQSLSGEAFRAVVERPRLLFYEEGLTATVSVEAQAERIAWRISGKMAASTRVDMPNQVLLGHLPLLFHPRPRDVLVVGLGSGVTAGSALNYAVERVTVVELEDAVVRASRFFEPLNQRPLADPRTRLLINDARSVLALSREQFDVI